MNARRFEMWEFPYASVIGLAEAIRYANDIGVQNIYDYNKPLVKKLREGLSSVAGAQVLDRGSQVSNIVTFHKQGFELSNIEQVLGNNNVYYSVSLKQNAIIDFTRKGVDWAIRLSPHYFNTEKEIESIVDIIASIKKRYLFFD